MDNTSLPRERVDRVRPKSRDKRDNRMCAVDNARMGTIVHVEMKGHRFFGRLVEGIGLPLLISSLRLHKYFTECSSKEEQVLEPQL